MHEKVASEFQDLLVKEANAFAVTNGVSDRMVESCREKLLDAEQKGATFLVGKPEKNGAAKLQPTLISGLTREMKLYNEESFGPSAAVFVARDDQHAIEIANDSQYGLNAAIHTRDFHRAWLMTRELDFGQVHINNMTVHDERKFLNLKLWKILVGTNLCSYTAHWRRQGQWLGEEQCAGWAARILRDEAHDVES